MALSRTIKEVDRRRKEPSPNPPTTNKARVALSMLLSVIFVLALSTSRSDLVKSAAIWLLYVVVAGGVIAIKPTESIKRVLLYASAPTAVFVAAASFLTWFAWILKMTPFCISCSGEWSFDDYQSLKRRTVIYLALAAPTLVGIAVGAYARAALLDTYATTKKVTVAELKGLQKKITIVLSILGLVGACLLANK